MTIRNKAGIKADLVLPTEVDLTLFLMFLNERSPIKNIVKRFIRLIAAERRIQFSTLDMMQWADVEEDTAISIMRKGVREKVFTKHGVMVNIPAKKTKVLHRMLMGIQQSTIG